MFRTLFLNTCVLTCCLLAACEKDADIPAAEPVTYTCFYNGAVDFYNFNSLLLLNNEVTRALTYNGVNSSPLGAVNNAEYAMMRPGTYRVTYTDTATQRNLITDNILTFEKDKKQTVYLSDSAGYFLTLVSDDTIERDTAMAQVRLVHLASDAPRVNFLTDTTPVEGLQDVGFREITAYVKIRPNPKPAFRLRYNNGAEDVTLVRKSFALEAGRCYTFVLRGNMVAPDGNPNKTINLTAIINQ